MKAKRSKGSWLNGGIIGLAICLALFLLDIFIYFPVFTAADGTFPQSALIVPMLTGHAFPLLSILFTPYDLFCEPTQSICAAWSIDPTPNAVPWTIETGEKGFCANVVLTPTSDCSNRAELLWFWGLVLLLFAVYFGLGSFIAWLLQRKHNH